MKIIFIIIVCVIVVSFFVYALKVAAEMISKYKGWQIKMSYTTHSGGNGVYSYQDENNIYHCEDCDLSFTLAIDYINHLKWHKQNGCCIPDSVFDRILIDNNIVA